MNASTTLQPAARLGRAWTAITRLAAQLPRSVLAFPLSLAVAVGVLVINETSYKHSMEALSRLSQRAEAMSKIDTVMRRLADAETGQRGYLLTGRKIYLEPYERASADTLDGIDWLRSYYARDPLSAAMLEGFQSHAHAKFEDLALTVSAYDAGQRLGWASIVDSEANAGHMIALRRLSVQLTNREKELVAADSQAVFDSLSTSRLGVNAMAAAGTLALLMLLRQSAALHGIQRRHTLALQDERERLEAEARHRTADLTELARHLQTVREDESIRLAGELNDGLGALLAATKVELAGLRRGLAGAPPEVLARLDHLNNGIDSGIALKRRIIENLRPSSLANLGLVTALEVQLREFSERVAIRVQSNLQSVPLSDSAQTTVYRLVQESLTNIAKYAQAKTVEVALRPSGLGTGNRSAVVSVVDDGRGFDPTAPSRSAHGLMGMRYRVEAVGGTLSVRSAPGHGTRIEARLPLQP